MVNEYMQKIQGKTIATSAFSSGLAASALIIIMLGLMLVPITLVSGESIPIKQGASVGLNGDTIHVVWKITIEYDDSALANEMDDMWVTYKFSENKDKAIESQLEDMIKQAVEKKVGSDYDIECKNLELDVDTIQDERTEVTLEFDLDGVVRITKTEREFNMAWKSMKVEGDVKIEEYEGRTVIETYKFTPMQTFALDWKAFSTSLEQWEITTNEGNIECYYRHKQAFPVAFQTYIYDVEMMFTLPGEPTIKGNLVVYDRSYVPPSDNSIFGMISASLPEIVVAGVAIAGIGGSVLLYKRRRSKKTDKKLYKRALARKEFQDFEEALELWGSQSENQRLERRYGWRGGSPAINIPKMKFKEATKDHFLDEYLLDEE